MAKNGPIIIVDDDPDDHEILRETLEELGVSNELIFFTESNGAFHYLKTTSDKPFLIISDINLPGATGLDFKMRIDGDPQLRLKSIPFVFLTTSVDGPAVTRAYTEMTIQGFFQKKSSMSDMKNMLRLIIEYWKVCNHPHGR